MSLEKWVEYGWLRREPTSPDEIRSLLGIVNRSLADANVEAISTDLRFITAFNAARHAEIVPKQLLHALTLPAVSRKGAPSLPTVEPDL